MRPEDAIFREAVRTMKQNNVHPFSDGSYVFVFNTEVEVGYAAHWPDQLECEKRLLSKGAACVRFMRFDEPIKDKTMTEEVQSTVTVGSDVFYKSQGSANGVYPSVLRTARVTEVIDADTASLCIFNPTGLFFLQNVKHGTEPGQWCWNAPPQGDGATF